MKELTVALKRQKSRQYFLAFLACVLLTLTAFGLVEYANLSYAGLVTALVLLALMQVGLQLVIFLHIGEEAKPKWKLLTFSFMFGTIVILVLGSIWIMNNLNYNMSSHDMKQYMSEQNKKGF